MTVRYYFSSPGIAPEEKAAVERFRQNAFRLIKYREQLANHPGYYMAQVPGGALSLAFIEGGRIPLGAYGELWAEGQMCIECPVCHKKAFVHSAGGFPLSGIHGVSGWCPWCGYEFKGISPVENFASFFWPILTKIREAKERFYDKFENREELTTVLAWVENIDK